MAEILRGLRFAKYEGGGQPRVMDVPVKVSQTIYRGAVLRLSATSGSACLAAEASTSLYGVALHNKSTTATQTTATLKMIPVTGDAIWIARGAPSTMTNAAAWSFLNKYADLELPTAGYFRIDTAASTKTMRIVGYPSKTAEATGAGREWYVKFIASASHYDFGLST